MNFKLDFQCDNDSFKYSPETEIAIILEQTSTDVLRGMTFGNIWDSNGNTIGQWEIET